MESSENQKSSQLDKPDFSGLDLTPEEEKPDKKPQKRGRKKKGDKEKEIDQFVKSIPMMANVICKFAKVPELKELEEKWLSTSSLAMLQKYEVGYLEEISFGLCLVEIVGIRLIDKFFDRKEKLEQKRRERAVATTDNSSKN